MASLVIGRGKVIKAKLELNIEGFTNFVKNERDIRAHFLHNLGRLVRKLLQTEFLSSEGTMTLKYKTFARGKKGYPVLNKIGKRVDRVIITSPALNLHENGRTYKGTSSTRADGSPHPKTGKLSPFARKQHITDPARKILTGKFPVRLKGNLQGLANQVERTVLEEAAAKASKGS